MHQRRNNIYTYSWKNSPSASGVRTVFKKRSECWIVICYISQVSPSKTVYTYIYKRKVDVFYKELPWFVSEQPEKYIGSNVVVQCR